jgi:serine/threonine protein kinase
MQATDLVMFSDLFSITIDEEKRLPIAIDAAVGLDYLHEKSIALFDFKSHNLLLDMRDEKRPICNVFNLTIALCFSYMCYSSPFRFEISVCSDW